MSTVVHQMTEVPMESMQYIFTQPKGELQTVLSVEDDYDSDGSHVITKGELDKMSVASSTTGSIREEPLSAHASGGNTIVGNLFILLYSSACMLY